MRIPTVEKQATRALKPLLALNTARHTNKHDNKIHSVGTARQYESIYKQAATWVNTTHDKRLRDLTQSEANQYLEARSTEIQQKQLNNERRALEIHLRATHNDSKINLERYTSEREQAEHSRAYSKAQIELIQSRQSERMAFSTRLASEAGLRAEELHTIRPMDEQPPSPHRHWSDNRFEGRNEWHRYSVVGKGGLIREVRFSPETAKELEERRLEIPEQITDRNVHYTKHYDLIGGKSFSNNFSRESQATLGWTEGAHGMRHSYAQRRMTELQNSGQSYTKALGIVSQEMGHFRSDITEFYLQ